MKRFFALLVATAVSAAVLLPNVSRADDWPTYGAVTYYGHYRNHAPSVPIYTPGYGYFEAAPNGAYHYIYVPGHPTVANDQGPRFYQAGYRSYYQAPGSLHYYYGSYGNPNAFYNNRR
jgi:hypothetical protein